MIPPWIARLLVLAMFYSISNWCQSSASSDEDKFFLQYSNNGQWEPLRMKRRDEAGYMMDICDQAHKKAGLDPAEIIASGFDSRTLKHSGEKYASIFIDIIQYGIRVGNSVNTNLRYWYITKGLRQDCVFYVQPIDDRARELRLVVNRHVCGIRM